jgi:hypothetical protein
MCMHCRYTNRAILLVFSSKERARIVLHNMMNAPAGTIFACDTEVSDIDLKTQGECCTTVCAKKVILQ